MKERGHDAWGWGMKMGGVRVVGPVLKNLPSAHQKMHTTNVINANNIRFSF